MMELSTETSSVRTWPPQPRCAPRAWHEAIGTIVYICFRASSASFLISVQETVTPLKRQELIGPGSFTCTGAVRKVSSHAVRKTEALGLGFSGQPSRVYPVCTHVVLSNYICT